LHNIQMSFNRPLEGYFNDPKSAKVNLARISQVNRDKETEFW